MSRVVRGRAPARGRRAARLALLGSLSGIVAIFFLWDRIEHWFGDILLSVGVLALFALVFRALLQLRCTSGTEEG